MNITELNDRKTIVWNAYLKQKNEQRQFVLKKELLRLNNLIENLEKEERREKRGMQKQKKADRLEFLEQAYDELLSEIFCALQGCNGEIFHLVWGHKWSDEQLKQLITDLERELNGKYQYEKSDIGAFITRIGDED